MRNPSEVSDKVMELLDKCSEIDNKIFELQEQKLEVQKDILNIKIDPFKVGEYALVLVPSGRKKVWKKCLLEQEFGWLYARPTKNDGELSDRHFNVGSAYTDFEGHLREIED